MESKMMEGFSESNLRMIADRAMQFILLIGVIRERENGIKDGGKIKKTIPDRGKIVEGVIDYL